MIKELYYYGSRKILGWPLHLYLNAVFSINPVLNMIGHPPNALPRPVRSDASLHLRNFVTTALSQTFNGTFAMSLKQDPVLPFFAGYPLYHLADSRSPRIKFKRKPGIHSTTLDPRSPISNLPLEILTETFSFLPQTIHHSLLNVSLVSRKFKDAVHPLMYQSIQFDFSADSFKVAMLFKAGSRKRFIKLVKLFDSNPALRPYVHHAWLTAVHGVSRKSRVDPQDLLQLLPNLRSLCVSPPPINFSVAPTLTTNLKHLTLGFGGAHKWYQGAEAHKDMSTNIIRIIRDHVGIPTLETLVLSGLHYVHEDWEGEWRKPLKTERALSFNTLAITHFIHDDVGIVSKLLQLTEKMKVLCFDQTTDDRQLDLKPLRGLPALISALSHHSSTLETVALDTGFKIFRVPQIHMKLAKFTSLRKLSIPPHLLRRKRLNEELGDLLPPNLETLQLHFCTRRLMVWQEDWEEGDELIETLESLLGLRRLRKIVFWHRCSCSVDEAWFGRMELLPRPVKKIMRAFIAKGIEMRTSDSITFQGTPIWD
jgi:hypothetical protein